jgi:MFS family permease
MTSLALSAPSFARADAGPRLLNRNFFLLWQAQLVSQFGNQAFTIALTFWTAQAMHSATMSGLMMMASILPLIVLGPLTGTFVDRQRSRVRIIAICDLLSGMAATLLAVGFLTGPDAWRPAMLFTAALLIGVCNAFFDPAVNALTPDLVPQDQIEAANALRQSSRQVTVLSAQGIGGILYSLFGPPALFLINGLSFLFAGASELLIKPAAPGFFSNGAGAPRLRPSANASSFGEARRSAEGVEAALPAPSTFLGQSAEGFRYVAAQPSMVAFLVTGAVFNALLMPISVLLPVYATYHNGCDVRVPAPRSARAPSQGARRSAPRDRS